jgi:hypothetical protein
LPFLPKTGSTNAVTKGIAMKTGSGMLILLVSLFE